MSREYSILDDGHMYKRRRATRLTSPVIALIVNRQHPQLSQFVNSSRNTNFSANLKSNNFEFHLVYDGMKTTQDLVDCVASVSDFVDSFLNLAPKELFLENFKSI